MSRPTVAKVTKAQADLEKLRIKLLKVASDIAMLCNNPMGSDVELCKTLRVTEAEIREATTLLRGTGNTLDAPLRILTARKAR